MRHLPLIPYETLKILINGSFTSKQMNYFIHLCKICDSDGVIKEKNRNSLLKKTFHKDPYLFSRGSGYRAMDCFLKQGLLYKNSKGELEIKGYKKAFKKGSKGMVTIPMFCFAMAFKNLSKIEKRVALYLIGQIRRLTKIKFFTINIQRMGTSFNTCFSTIYAVLEKLKHFFTLSFFHQEKVCRIAYKKEYLLSSSSLEEMITYFEEREENAQKMEYIKILMEKKHIKALLSDRKKQLYLKEFKSYVVPRKEVDIEENIKSILYLLCDYTNKEIEDILEMLSSKLRQFTDPILHLKAYVRAIIQENIFKPII